jgi:8-oxo-dGTP pyrophosphatase MutT (NUDIX family)
VLIPVLEHRGEEKILLIERTRHPRDPYSGQICLPGGALEAGDASLADCALREAREEVGIQPPQVRIFAELDWHETSLGHRVKPFAGRICPPCRIVPHPGEVEKVLYLPLRGVSPEMFAECPIPGRPDPEIMDRGARATRPRERRTLAFCLEGHEVWGLTARILYSFFFGSSPPTVETLLAR